MKKLATLSVALLLIASGAWSQAAFGEPDPTAIGIDTAQQKLKEVSVEKFESAGFWSASISPDEGIIQARLFDGSPAGKVAIEDETAAGIDPKVADKFVFGARVDFFRRGFNTFRLFPSRAIPIEGITKTISVWVAGRNNNHMLKLIVQDFFGREYELTLGKLNFQGWKKLTVAVPPQSLDGFTGIVQRNPAFKGKMGLKIVGFEVECDPMEAFGVYYIYLDDLRAVTDLFAEENRDEDDIDDDW
ncbi:MAG: flagellar filament protein FlaA [Spirochaetia bacterium]|nr:flagellar filament protein FlaA [Spirochaetia bacterium]